MAIHKYPQTPEIEAHCVSMLADLWHAPYGAEPVGTSTTGTSEGGMLAGLALKRRWQQARRDAGRPGHRPNIVMGANVQVVWENFANHWEVEPRYVALEGNVFHLTADHRSSSRTRTPSAWWRFSARRWTAATSRWSRSARDSTSTRTGRRSPPRRCGSCPQTSQSVESGPMHPMHRQGAGVYSSFWARLPSGWVVVAARVRVFWGFVIHARLVPFCLFGVLLAALVPLLWVRKRGPTTECAAD